MLNVINMADAVQDLYVIGPIDESDAHKRLVAKRLGADHDYITRILKGTIGREEIETSFKR